MTRRELLGAGLASTLAAANAGKVDISQISAITDELARSPADAITFARQYGLRWVELRGVPGAKRPYTSLADAELKAAAKELERNGLRVFFLDASLLKHSLPGTEPVLRKPETPEARERRIAQDQARFDNRLEELKKALNAAHRLGTAKVRVFSFTRVSNPEALLPRLADILGPMVEEAGRQKVRLLVENEGSCNVSTCAQVVAICKLIPSRWFGINWDTLNGDTKENPAFPDGYNLLPKDRIGNIQIKGRALLAGPQRQDWPAIFRTTNAEGYHGQYGLETHIDIGGAGQIPASHECMREIQRILAAL